MSIIFGTKSKKITAECIWLDRKKNGGPSFKALSTGFCSRFVNSPRVNLQLLGTIPGNCQAFRLHPMFMSVPFFSFFFQVERRMTRAASAVLQVLAVALASGKPSVLRRAYRKRLRTDRLSDFAASSPPRKTVFGTGADSSGAANRPPHPGSRQAMQT